MELLRSYISPPSGPCPWAWAWAVSSLVTAVRLDRPLSDEPVKMAQFQDRCKSCLQREAGKFNLVVPRLALENIAARYIMPKILSND